MNVDLYPVTGRFSLVGSQAVTYVQEFVAQIGFTVCQVFDAIEPMVEYNDAEKAEEKTETKDK